MSDAAETKEERRRARQAELAREEAELERRFEEKKRERELAKLARDAEFKKQEEEARRKEEERLRRKLEREAQFSAELELRRAEAAERDRIEADLREKRLAAISNRLTSNEFRKREEERVKEYQDQLQSSEPTELRRRATTILGAQEDERVSRLRQEMEEEEDLKLAQQRAALSSGARTHAVPPAASTAADTERERLAALARRRAEMEAEEDAKLELMRKAREQAAVSNTEGSQSKQVEAKPKKADAYLSAVAAEQEERATRESAARRGPETGFKSGDERPPMLRYRANTLMNLSPAAELAREKSKAAEVAAAAATTRQQIEQAEKRVAAQQKVLQEKRDADEFKLRDAERHRTLTRLHLEDEADRLRYMADRREIQAKAVELESPYPVRNNKEGSAQVRLALIAKVATLERELAAAKAELAELDR